MISKNCNCYYLWSVSFPLPWSKFNATRKFAGHSRSKIKKEAKTNSKIQTFGAAMRVLREVITENTLQYCVLRAKSRPGSRYITTRIYIFRVRRGVERGAGSQSIGRTLAPSFLLLGAWLGALFKRFLN